MTKFDPSKIFPATEMITEPKLKALLLGPSKSGKTTALSTLPGKNLLIDCDGRADSVAGESSIDVIHIVEEKPESGDAWNELISLQDWLWSQIHKGEFPYTGIMFDGISGMNRFCMSYCLTLRTGDGTLASKGFGDTPAQHHYNPYMAALSKFIFNTLAMPVHVIYTSHYYVYEDKHTNRLEWWPKVYGNIRTEISSWFNECYGLFTKKSRDKSGNEVHKYYWQTAADKKLNFLGSSLNKLGALWQSPLEIDFTQEPVGFAKLLSLRKEENTQTE